MAEAGIKQSAAAKVARIPVKVVAKESPPKPPWIRMHLPSGERYQAVKQVLRNHQLHTVCEEASCPNLGECFSAGTATFMILGDICTRRCPFCDVAHGRPLLPDPSEPARLAQAISDMGLRYVVITSVDRDDLADGGAEHFARCISSIRALSATLGVEILVPDFRGRLDKALLALAEALPDVFNHNLETVPRLYRPVRPGADYAHSLELLARFASLHPHIPTKSGLMLGLGETLAEVLDVMANLRASGVTMLTLGQYLQPSPHHLTVERYIPPAVFEDLRIQALALGFRHVASGAMVRSSYHAETQTVG